MSNHFLKKSAYDSKLKAAELVRPLRSAGIIKPDDFEARIQVVLQDAFEQGCAHGPMEDELVESLKNMNFNPPPEQRIDNLIKRIAKIEETNDAQQAEMQTIRELLKLK